MEYRQHLKQGNLETKYKVKDLGMTLTEKWSTDNTLNTTVDVADKLLPGLKVTLDTTFSPSTGSKSGKLKTEYKHEAATVTADMDLGLSAINATAVVGHKGWLAGYQTCFDLTKSAVTKNNLASATLPKTLSSTPAWSMGLILVDLSTKRCHPPWRLEFPLDGALLPQQLLLELEQNMFSLTERQCVPRSTTRARLDLDTNKS